MTTIENKECSVEWAVQKVSPGKIIVCGVKDGTIIRKLNEQERVLAMERGLPISEEDSNVILGKEEKKKEEKKEEVEILSKEPSECSIEWVVQRPSPGEICGTIVRKLEQQLFLQTVKDYIQKNVEAKEGENLKIVEELYEYSCKNFDLILSLDHKKNYFWTSYLKAQSFLFYHKDRPFVWTKRFVNLCKQRSEVRRKTLFMCDVCQSCSKRKQIYGDECEHSKTCMKCKKFLPAEKVAEHKCKLAK